MARLTAFLLAAVALPHLAAPAGTAADKRFALACERLAGKRGIALVAADPREHRLLALVHPALAAEPHPPGSVFKLVTALAAIEGGQAPATASFRCPGYFRPRGARQTLPCWKVGGHGHLALEEAVARSCNVTFYGLSEALGPGAIATMARRGGLGLAPGWLRTPRGAAASVGFGIGEGTALAVTPLQLAGFVGAIAVGGPAMLPAWEPTAATGPALAPEPELARLRAGMRAAVVNGSARNAGTGRVDVAGKTGTATYTDGSNRTYGWFVGYAPAVSPRLAIAVFEKQSTGFGDAAKLARQVFEAWVAAGSP